MTVKKRSKYHQQNLQMNSEPIHTKISYLLVMCAIFIMAYIAIRHWSDEASWGRSALMQFSFAIFGLVGTQLLAKQPLFPGPNQYQLINMDTGIRTLVITLVAMVTQLISQAVLSFTIAEEALYFVFAAIGEEIFFRGLILGMFIRFDPDDSKFSLAKIIGVFVQGLMFTVIHQNYYSNLPMLLSVFVGGIILGFFYLIWRDLTANILGHFFLNLIAVGSILVIL